MRYVILGGTGTLGQATAKALLAKRDTDRVLIVSRDELKQKQMAQAFGNDPGLKFAIGDIRDPRSLKRLTGIHDVVFHFAALKHIDVAEDNPEECLATNAIGSTHVAEFCEDTNAAYCVFSSTDKAVSPINAYGMCKAFSERMFYRRNELISPTRFSVFRWGNVLGSRGSVLSAFAHSLLTTGSVSVTSMDMTRYWIRIEDAVAFMIGNYQTAPLTRAAIPPIKAASLIRVIRAIADHVGVPHYEIKLTGLRKGEKIHEDIDSGRNSGSDAQYSDLELKSLISEALSCPS